MLTSASTQARSIIENGGFTEWFSGSHSTGYTVGNNNYSLVIKGVDPRKYASVIALREALEDFKGYAYTLERRCVHVDGIGGWLDVESGDVYLDVIVHVDNLAEALELAKLNQELAIYDIANKQVIDIC